MGGRAGGGASGGMGSRSRANAQDRFYTFNLGNGQTVSVNKSKSPADVVKQANRLKKQLGAAIQGMDSYKSIKSYSDLAKAKVEADAWKGKSAQRIENALRIGKAMTKGSRGGYGMIPKS